MIRVSETLSRWIDTAMPILIGTSLLVLCLHKIVALDLWWQLTTGQWILENGFPRIDPFSYGFPEHPWIELRWLYYVAIYTIASQWGLNGLIVAKCVVMLATFSVFARLMRARESWIPSVGLLAIVVLIYPRLRIRPELMSFLWIALTLLCLDRYKRDGSTRWLFGLPVVQLLWVNTHTLWILGPVLIWTSVAGELTGQWLRRNCPSFPFSTSDLHPILGDRLRALVLAAIAVSACSFATPYFVEGAIYPITLIRQIGIGSELGSMIDELRSPLLDERFGFLFIAYLAVIWTSGASFLLRPERVPIGRMAWWAGFLILSLLSARNLSLFGIVAGTAMTANLRDWVETQGEGATGHLHDVLPWMARGIALVLVIGIPISVATDHFWRSQGMPHGFGFGVAPHRFPIRAMAFVREQGLPTPVIASLGDGGYILHVEGEKSVFVDGRLEVYGQATLEKALLALVDREGFRSIVEKHSIQTALISIPYLRNALLELERLPDWIPVYYDDDYVLYVLLTPETQPLIERLAIHWESPVRYEVTLDAFFTPRDWLAGFAPRVSDNLGFVNLGDLFMLVENLHEARTAFREAVRLRPGDGRSWLHVYMLEETLGDPGAAERALLHVEAGIVERKNVAQVRDSLRRTRRAQCRELIRRYARQPDTIGRDPDSRFDLGACFELTEDVERAVETWKSLLVHTTDFTPAREGIERLARRTR